MFLLLFSLCASATARPGPVISNQATDYLFSGPLTIEQLQRLPPSDLPGLSRFSLPYQFPVTSLDSRSDASLPNSPLQPSSSILRAGQFGESVRPQAPTKSQPELRVPVGGALEPNPVQGVWPGQDRLVYKNARPMDLTAAGRPIAHPHYRTPDQLAQAHQALGNVGNPAPPPTNQVLPITASAGSQQDPNTSGAQKRVPIANERACEKCRIRKTRCSREKPTCPGLCSSPSEL